MREHTVVPRSRISPGAWPHIIPGVRRVVACLSGRDEGRTFRDKLCAIAICALVFASVIMCAWLLVQEFGWYAGTGAAGTALMGQDLATPAAASNTATVDPTTLTLIAVPINLLIFVALGLYLRWDSKHNP